MCQHFPRVLDKYYALGETLSGNDQLRTYDYTTWGIERNEH